MVVKVVVTAEIDAGPGILQTFPHLISVVRVSDQCLVACMIAASYERRFVAVCENEWLLQLLLIFGYDIIKPALIY